MITDRKKKAVKNYKLFEASETFFNNFSNLFSIKKADQQTN